MSRHVRRGLGPSSTLVTPDQAGNVVGIDPHKRTLTATIVDPRGGLLASEHFRVSGDGHRALEAWAWQFGAIVRFGVEGASAWGRHTAIFLSAAAMTCAMCARTAPRSTTGRANVASQTRWTPSGSRARRSRTRCCPRRSNAPVKTPAPISRPSCWRSGGERAARLIKRRQHLLTEAEALLRELPLELLERLPGTKKVRPRLAALRPPHRPPAARSASRAECAS